MDRIERLLSGNVNQEDLLINENEKKERLLAIEKRLNEMNDSRKKEDANIIKINEKISKAVERLKQTDTDEAVLYWSKNINDKRLKLFGRKSCTKKLIKYKDIPFIDVKLAKMNGSFTDIVRNDAEGVYETKYKSDIGEDGIAIIQIFVMKRNLPDNKRLISYLNTELSELQELLQKSKLQIKVYDADEEYCMAIQKLDKNVIDRPKLLNEQKQINQKIIEIKQLLSETNKRDETHAHIYEQSKAFISNNMNYFRVIKIIDEIVSFNSELIYQFLNYYQEYNKLIGNNKTTAIFEISKNSEVSETNDDNKSIDRFCCPISKFLMTDPYVNVCGHSFEFASIIKYIEENKNCKCPSCNKEITKSSIVPNNELRQIINDWIRNRDSEYINEYINETVIKNQAEFLNEVENKKNIEENLRQLKLNIQMTEIKLKETNLRIEKWLKTQKKLTKESETPQSTGEAAKPPIQPKPVLNNSNRSSQANEQTSTISDYSDSSDYEEVVNIRSPEEKF